MTITQDISTDITAYEVEAFTCGDCFAFAVEVQRTLGFAVVFYGSNFKGKSEVPNNPDELDWAHVVNVLPNGDLFDVTGVQTVDQMVSHWDEILKGELLPGSWTGIYTPKDQSEMDDMLKHSSAIYRKADVVSTVARAITAYL